MRFIDSGIRPAQHIMDTDALLLNTLGEEPILHFYAMEGKAATYGIFTKPEELLHLEACRQHQITLAKRPTGGGIIFHFLDLAFSYLIPKSHPRFSENTLQNYHTVNQLVVQGLKELFPHNDFSFLPKEQKCLSTFCMAHPTPYDVLCKGKKLAGASQRKTRAGLLHQGSISILAPPLALLTQLTDPETAQKMIKTSFYLTTEPSALQPLREQIKGALFRAMC